MLNANFLVIPGTKLFTGCTNFYVKHVRTFMSIVTGYTNFYVNEISSTEKLSPEFIRYTNFYVKHIRTFMSTDNKN